MFGFFKKILPDPAAREVARLRAEAAEIERLAGDFEKLSDTDLRAKTLEFREKLGVDPEAAPEPRLPAISPAEKSARAAEIREKLAPIAAEALAVAREAARRVTGEFAFPVQLVGALVLHRGSIAEMKTGEGKTLVGTLAIYLEALLGRGVHVVTVNEYLAGRDFEKYGEVLRFLGLTTGLLTNGLPAPDRQIAYRADVTYGTTAEFGFDYLRDNMARDPAAQVQRGLAFALVDEVDSVLIDEARTPLIISAPMSEAGEMYKKFDQIAQNLRPGTAPPPQSALDRLAARAGDRPDADGDFLLDEKARTAVLTETGVEKCEKMLGVENLFTAEHYATLHHLEAALKARAVFKKDRDYVVTPEGAVALIDQNTGRMMPGRRLSDGLHQAIEAKENVEIRRESMTVAQVTIQNFFRMYDRLAGMTGTALTDAEEFGAIYGLSVLPIPTHRPLARRDLADAIFPTENGKIRAAAAEVSRRHRLGQPVLVGTASVEKSEKISEFLAKSGIPHEVLNAKNHAREAEIIARAADPGAVTIATNMAGRGTDIKLPADLPDAIAIRTLAAARHAADAGRTVRIRARDDRSWEILEKMAGEEK